MGKGTNEPGQSLKSSDKMILTRNVATVSYLPLAVQTVRWTTALSAASGKAVSHHQDMTTPYLPARFPMISLGTYR